MIISRLTQRTVANVTAWLPLLIVMLLLPALLTGCQGVLNEKHLKPQRTIEEMLPNDEVCHQWTRNLCACSSTFEGSERTPVYTLWLTAAPRRVVDRNATIPLT